MAAAPAGDRLYVCNFGGDTVSVIDTTTATPKLLPPIRVGRQPSGIAITSDGRFIYVANTRDNTISVIEAATNKVFGPIKVGGNPFGVAVSPDGRQVRVTNADSDTVSHISFVAPSTWTVDSTTAPAARWAKSRRAQCG